MSPLSGKELIAKKIRRTVVMGGRFFGTWPFEFGYGINTPHVTAEWNIYADIPAAQTVTEEWPGEMVFSSYETGNWLITLKKINDDENRKNVNPAAHSYFVHHGKGGRESWDLTAMLYAVRPEAGYWNLHPYGKITVEPLEFTLRDEVGIRVKPDDLDGLAEKIRSLLEDEGFRNRIAGIRDRYIAHFGRSGEIGGQYILDLIKKQIAARRQE